MVRPARLEQATFGFGGRRSIQLSDGRFGVDLLAATDALVARHVDEGRLVVRADPDYGPCLVPTLSGLAIADGLAAAFDLTLPN